MENTMQSEEIQECNNTYIDMLKMMEAYPAMLDYKDVKQIVRCGRDAAKDLMKSGEFKVVEAGGQKRVSKPVLAHYLSKTH